MVGMESLEEKFRENGSWIARRRLNGAENSQGQALRLNANDLPLGRICRVGLYRYQ